MRSPSGKILDMTNSTKPPHVVMTIICPRCQEKQAVQVRAGGGFAQMSGQAIRCVKCERDFDAMVPDVIVGGPFSLTTP